MCCFEVCCCGNRSVGASEAVSKAGDSATPPSLAEPRRTEDVCTQTRPFMRWPGQGGRFGSTRRRWRRTRGARRCVQLKVAGCARYRRSDGVGNATGKGVFSDANILPVVEDGAPIPGSFIGSVKKRFSRCDIGKAATFLFESGKLSDKRTRSGNCLFGQGAVEDCPD